MLPISGRVTSRRCELLDIVEAAHIWPYRTEADNHPGNGLLLRADLHTLFDLDLLGIDPSLAIRVHPLAAVAGYEYLEGKQLQARGRSSPSAQALEMRWASFLENLKAGPNGRRGQAPLSASAPTLISSQNSVEPIYRNAEWIFATEKSALFPEAIRGDSPAAITYRVRAQQHNDGVDANDGGHRRGGRQLATERRFGLAQ
jgi:HNH endonuclease